MSEIEKRLDVFIEKKCDDLGTLCITDSPSVEYLKDICEEYFRLKVRLNLYNVSISKETPKMPLDKIINETRQVGVCSKCGSSLVRKYLLAFWTPVYCLNKNCK